MNMYYKQVFKISILHSYFDGDICTCLQFIPTAATLDVMERYGFKINPGINGFQFYSSASVPLSDSLAYIKTATGQVCFEFDLVNNNPGFYCFTDLPVNWIGQLCYNSSLATLQPNSNTYLLAGKLSAPETTVMVGNLKIMFDDLLKYTTGAQPVNFEISYAARATQWQYYVVNRNAVNLDNASVKGKGEITFENSGSVTIETGEQALLFSSGDQLIPLSRFPKHKFDLVNNLKPASAGPTKNNPAKMIIKGLPNPDPLRMGTVQINAKTQVSSPIYIYV